jgi:diguanylate cyclase (GGDEF)-like protein
VSYLAGPCAGAFFRLLFSPQEIMMISPEEILRAKILLVDDCEDNLFTIAESLRLAGYTNVTPISDPKSVRALHEVNNYDLIVLDMQMPHMDGLEVMESLAGVEKTPYLPVLTITGNSDYKIAALKAGARDFITKPYDLTELHQRIHNLLEVRLLYKSVSEQNRVQQELALRDPLTNLPNRRLLMDRLEKAIQRAAREEQSVALFFLDLDGFKQVNDVHGHPVGDQLLKTVAQRLQNMTREHDTVARLGGDEFVMLISGIADASDAVRPATDALTILSQPYKINDIEVQVTASIGIAFYPAHGHDAESLIAHADHSLLDAKRSGKNRFHLAKMIEQSSAAV